MRIEILKKINQLEQKCKVCPLRETMHPRYLHRYCIDECPVGAEIKSLGKEIDEIGERAIQEVLNKGEAMTREDVQWLRNKDLTKREIANAAGINNSNEISNFFKELNVK